MRTSFDEAYRNLCTLSQEKWVSLSESDTRSKLIDAVFIRCLNWQEPDIKREEHEDTGYIDYVFKVRDKTAFVVEAKKQGTYFGIPVSFNFRRKLKVRFVIQDRSLKDALVKTQTYCSAKGARFGVITNGLQYLIFEAIRYGEEWEEGNCLVFYSLDDIKRNFADFWNVLSKDAVEVNSLVERVAMDTEEIMFFRPIDGVEYRNVIQPRNDLSRYMTPLIRYAFGEITEPEKIDLLKSCYVYQKQFDPVDKTLKSYFSLDMPRVYKGNDIRKIIEEERAAGHFEEYLRKMMQSADQVSQEPMIVLLLGGIGSGKTTFIHRYFNIVLKDDEKRRTVWLYVNFKDAPTNLEAIREYILQSALSDFEHRYEELHKYLKSNLSLGEISPTIESLTKIVKMLKALQYDVYLIVDNVDQHKSMSPTFHEKVFLESNSLTKALRIMTIMTLREQTYYRSRMSGVFNAYYIQKFLVSPPEFMQLIRHRLDYALEKLFLPEVEFKKIVQTNLDFGQKNYRDIKDFLSIVRDSLCPQTRERIPTYSPTAFIMKTSGEDMRYALDLFAQFLISGNTKIDEMLDIFRTDGTYTIAYHHFVKSIVLGDYKYFTQEFSYLINLFDFDLDYSKSHFLMLRILAYANDHLANESDMGRGYIEINMLKAEAADVKINSRAVEDCLMRLARYGLIVLDTRSLENLENASYFKLTECGHYYLHVLINTFVYLDLVWMDTPIADIDLVKRLRSTLVDRPVVTDYDDRVADVRRRFERTEAFLQYLKTMEDKELIKNPEYLESKLCKYKFVQRMINGYEQQREYILDKMLRRKDQYQ